MQVHTLPARLAQRYEIRSRIGRGGMADVWSAWDLRLQRQVALKTMRRELVDDPRMRRRFEAEGRAIARVVHPNVVQVYDRGEVDGVPFLVMEYAPGPTLAEVLQSGSLPPVKARAIALGVARGLSAAHAEGVSHADVKPGNVMLVGGEAKLTDFGIARLDDAGDTGPVTTVLGTPSYLAPERLTGSAATPRSDVYSAGVMLREMLTGARTPASDDDRAPHIHDATLAAIVERATKVDASERYGDGAALAAALAGEPETTPLDTRHDEATVAVQPTGATDTQTLPTEAKRAARAPQHRPPAPVPASRRLPAALASRRRQLLVGAVVVVLLWAAVAAVALFGRDSGSGSSPARHAPATSVPSLPSVVTTSPQLPVFPTQAPKPAPHGKPHPAPKQDH